MVKSVKKARFFGISAMLIALFGGCDDNVGLGSSVDVEAPTIEIATPAVSDVVAGTITVSGSCDDDKGVTRVSLSLKNTATGEKFTLGDAAVTSGTSWEYAFNAYRSDGKYNGYDYADGTYVVDVVAYDGAGRSSGTASRSFDIDNTPPVFAVTKPNSLLLADETSYGRSVKIAGEIADDHSIKSMDIKLLQVVYDTEVSGDTVTVSNIKAVEDVTSSLAKSSFSGFETAGGTEVQIAQYYTEETVPASSSEEYKLYQNYMAMYRNSQDDGADGPEGKTRSLYLVATVTDVAGNTSERTYAKSNLTSLIKEVTNLADTSESLQTAQLKKILNGTYDKNELTSDQQSAVKSILTGTYNQDSLEKKYTYISKNTLETGVSTTNYKSMQNLALSINSDNSPKFEIAGCALTSTVLANETWNETGSESKITVKISAGLDGVLVRPSTLEAQLYEYSTEKGTSISNYLDPDPNLAIPGTDITTVKNGNSLAVTSLETSVDMASYSIQLPKLTSGKKYIVNVLGKDENDNDLACDLPYGFVVTSAGVAPEVDFTGNYYVRADAFKNGYNVSVTVTDPGETVSVTGTENECGVYYSADLYAAYVSNKNTLANYASKKATLVSANTRISGEASFTATDEEKTYTVNLPLKFTPNATVDNYTILLKIRAKNASEYSSEKTYLIWADNKAPVIQMLNNDFVLYSSEHGTYTTTWDNTTGGVITENNIYYSNTTGGTYTVNGTWADKDGAGTGTMFCSTTQTTKPTVTVTGEKAGKVDVSVPTDSGWTALSSSEIASGLTDEVKWNYAVPITEGTDGIISFFAVDAVGNVSDVTSFQKITYDLGVPVITLSDVPSVNNKDITITGTVNESLGIDTANITVKAVRESDKTITATINGGTANASARGTVPFILTIPADNGTNDGSWTVTATAKDNAGRFAEEKKVSFVLDATIPIRKDNILVSNKAWSDTSWYNNTTLKISGEFIDATTGVSAVYVQVVAPDATGITPLDGTNYNTLDGLTGIPAELKDDATHTYSFAQNVSGFKASNKANVLRFIAVDKAGNVSAVGVLDIYVDMEAPDAEADATGKVMTNGSSNFTITGTATDDASGIASVEITILKKGTTNAVSLTTTESDYGKVDWSADANGKVTWEATVKPNNTTWFTTEKLTANPNVYAIVTDKAGNEYNAKVTALSVDTNKPTTKISTPARSLALNGTYDISGTVADDNSPLSVSLYYSKTSAANLSDWTLFKKITTEAAPATPAANTEYGKDVSEIYGFKMEGFNFTTYSDAASTLTGTADLYVLLVAEDEAGNKSITDGSIGAFTATDGTNGAGYYKYNVDLNSDRPIVKAMNLAKDKDILMYADKAAINGTVEDDDANEDSVIKTIIFSTTPITSTTGVEMSTAKAAKEFAIKTATGNSTHTTSEDAYYAAVKQGDYYDITEFDPVAGTWKFIPYDTSDGAKNVYVYVVDNAGTVFYTGQKTSTPYLTNPYVKFTTEAVKNECSTCFSYTSDSGAPQVSAKSLVYSADKSTAAGTIDDVDATTIVGGTRKYVQFVIKATDASGIKAMAMTIKDTSGKTQTYDATDSDSTFTPTDNETEATWTTPYLDISSWATGTVTANITVTDQSGLGGVDNMTFTIDNSAPTTRVTSHTASAELVGEFTLSGSATDEGLASLDVDNESALQWVIPKKTETYATVSSWNNLSRPSTASWGSWNYSGSETILTPYYDTDTYKTTESDGLYLIPLWIRAEDMVGNVSYTEYIMRFNPDGAVPRTTLSSPSENSYTAVRPNGSSVDIQAAVMGGSIDIFGSAQDNIGLGSAYIQIDYNNDGNFDSTDMQWLAEKYLIWNASNLNATAGAAIGNWKGRDSDWWGIPAEVTSDGTGGTWTITINKEAELDISGDVRIINVRACVLDVDSDTRHISAWTAPVVIAVDATAPVIGASVEAVNKYDNYTGINSEVTATTSYVEGMYLRGGWYFVVSVEDETSVKEYSVRKTIGGSSSPATFDAETVDNYGNGKKGYTLYIPVDMDSASVSYLISVTDGDNKKATKTYSFNIDNTAPVMTSLKGNGDALTTASSSGITKLDTTTKQQISNSNYAYTISGEITEAGSGFDRLAFYFLRDKATMATEATNRVSRLYDLDYTKNTSTPVYIEGTDKPSNLTTLTVTQDASNSYTLYGTTLSGTLKDKTHFACTDAMDSHIRVGGLIYIGGLYRKITNVTGNTVGFDSEVSTSVTTAVFPYAQVVDNTTTEKTERDASNGNRFKIEQGDDGDNMPEMVSKVGTTYTWEATLYSDVIPDGPITLVCVAFDKAGNVSGTSIQTSIQNNAPRIARLYLGTDLDGNGKYAFGTEFNTYTFATIDGTYADDYKDNVNFATGATTFARYGKPFKITKGFAVLPEFTGGNGVIKMAFLNDASSVTTFRTAAQATKLYDEAESGLVTGTVSTNLVNNDNTSPNAIKQFVINDTNLTSITDGTGKAMSFTFWDSTEGTVCGTDSNYCFVRISDLTVDLVDEAGPKEVIDPFYWNSLTDNSIYGSASATAMNKLQGHIELEDDLTTAVKATSGDYGYGPDPKVSGKITMTGYAYDDQRLGSLWITFDDLVTTKANQLTKAVTSDRIAVDTTNGTYTAGGKTYYQAAYYTSAEGSDETAKWTTASGKLSDGYSWEFSVSGAESDDAFFSQDGHKVKWTLSIDTEQITYKAGKDKYARVLAIDHSGNVSTVTTTASGTASDYETYHKPFYQMDVVPYIQGIKTNLSLLKKKNTSVNDRTALGHYTVSAAEKPGIYGFNFDNNGTNVVDKSGHETTLEGAASAALNGTTYTTYALKDITAFTSGEVYIQQNNVRSLNNVNGNDVKGSADVTLSQSNYATYAYNRLPNGDNNDLLTDDVILDVWYIDSTAATPMSGGVDQPVMKVDPITGQLGFAFANGALNFSMPGNVKQAGLTTPTEHTYKYSYDNWCGGFDFFTSIGMTYDSLGHAYGVAAGGDINASSADNFVLFSSRWGGSGTDNYGAYAATQAYAIERIAQAGSATGGSDYVFQKQRIMSPSLATAVHGTSTNLYLAYYDDLNKEIRFKRGSTNLTAGQRTMPPFGLFKSAYANTVTTQEPKAYSFDIANVNVVAGTKLNGSAFNTGHNAGQYVSIAVVANGDTDIVVLVWYDAVARKLMYRYSKTDPQSIPGNSSDGWSDAEDVFASWGDENTGIGWYCKIAVDNNNGIHVAAYDSINSDVVYAYKTAYNVTGWTTMKVDSNGIVGSELTLDVAMKNGKPVPYIGYYASASVRPKLAYLYTESNMSAGTDDGDAYTGTWEVTIIPTTNSVPEDHINVGIWKTSAGVLKNSTTTYPKLGKEDGYTSSGRTYGNGTANPVLGYKVLDGTGSNIETAQMQ